MRAVKRDTFSLRASNEERRLCVCSLYYMPASCLKNLEKDGWPEIEFIHLHMCINKPIMPAHIFIYMLHSLQWHSRCSYFQISSNSIPNIGPNFIPTAPTQTLRSDAYVRLYGCKYTHTPKLHQILILNPNPILNHNPNIPPNQLAFTRSIYRLLYRMHRSPGF